MMTLQRKASPARGVPGRAIANGIAIAAFLSSAPALAQSVEGPDFFLDRGEEIALARSAAPETVSDPATIWVLTPEGYEVAVEGVNSFNCVVLRRFSADTRSDSYDWDGLIAPICYDAYSSTTHMQEQLLRAEMGLRGDPVESIEAAVNAAYMDGSIPVPDQVAFAYMFSGAQRLSPRLGHWHPHMMIWVPYATNDDLGGNAIGSAHPFVLEHAGAPRALVTLPVDGGGFIQPAHSSEGH